MAQRVDPGRDGDGRWADSAAGVDEAVAGRDVMLDKAATLRVTGETVEVKMSAAGVVKADSVNTSMSAAAVTYAGDDADLSWSRAGLVAAGKEVRMSYAVAQLALAGKRLRVSSGGLGAVLTRQAQVDRGYIGLLVAGKAQIADDTKILLQPTGATALGAGFLAGLLLALAFLWRPLLARISAMRTEGKS